MPVLLCHHIAHDATLVLFVGFPGGCRGSHPDIADEQQWAAGGLGVLREGFSQFCGHRGLDDFELAGLLDGKGQGVNEEEPHFGKHGGKTRDVVPGRGACIHDSEACGVGMGREEFNFGGKQLELAPVQGLGGLGVVLLARGVGRKHAVEVTGGWEVRRAVGIHVFPWGLWGYIAQG